MISRRAFLFAASAGAVCRPAQAALPLEPTPGLGKVAAERGLLYGSYIDPWELKDEPDYAAVCAHDAG